MIWWQDIPKFFTIFEKSCVRSFSTSMDLILYWLPEGWKIPAPQYYALCHYVDIEARVVHLNKFVTMMEIHTYWVKGVILVWSCVTVCRGCQSLCQVCTVWMDCTGSQNTAAAGWLFLLDCELSQLINSRYPVTEIRELAKEAHQELHVLNKTPCSNSTELVHIVHTADQTNSKLATTTPPPQSKSYHLGVSVCINMKLTSDEYTTFINCVRMKNPTMHCLAMRFMFPHSPTKQ